MNTQRNRPKVVRISERAYKLAGASDPEGNRGRGIEYALEILQQLQRRIDDEPGGMSAGPLSGKAFEYVFVFESLVRDRVFDQAMERGIVAYGQCDPQRWQEYLETIGAKGETE